MIDFALPLAAMPAVRVLRDPTRGGLPTVAHEIARATGLDPRLRETAIPDADVVLTRSFRNGIAAQRVCLASPRGLASGGSRSGGNGHVDDQPQAHLQHL